MPGPSLPLSSDRFTGRKLGKYEVLARLSTGGMSEIFLAFHRGLGGFRKLVVLKQILPDIKGEEQFVRMFLDEARLTAGFAHPNIAQVFDLDVQDGELFLALEFVPGATLVEVAKACREAAEPIPIGFTLMAVRDTALALHYAHTFVDAAGKRQMVIHRDIAEKNIMVTYEGVTKLLDFGIAKNPELAGRTTVGMVKGTSGYMSPEQIMGQPLDGRTDIYSLGVVLHECLTGMRLFPAKKSEDALLAALQDPVAPPSRQNRAVPPEIDQIALRALERNRENRYATALELAREIDRAASGLIWLPEQSGALLQRHFAARRDQTRKLLEAAPDRETTAEVRLADLLARDTAPEKEPPEEVTVALRTPTRHRRKEARTVLEAEPMTIPLSVVEKMLEPERPLGVDTAPPSAPTPVAMPFEVVTAEVSRTAVTRRRVLGPLLLGGVLALGALGVAALFVTGAEPPRLPDLPRPILTEAPPPLRPPAEPPAVVSPTPAPVAKASPPPSQPSPPPPPAVAAEVPKPAPVRRPSRPKAHHRAGTEPTSDESAAKASREEADEEPGLLSLVITPPAQVQFKSQDFGQSPLVRRNLPAGRHVLKLTGPDGRAFQLPVEIKSGELTSLRVSLSSLEPAP